MGDTLRPQYTGYLRIARASRSGTDCWSIVIPGSCILMETISLNSVLSFVAFNGKNGWSLFSG
jgi:hypothetical protein